jgi:hypothetical protein
MRVKYWTVLPHVFLALAFGAWGTSWAQLPAAKVMSVAGVVKVVDAQGRERTLERGAEVRSGDKIITADGALVQMRLNDGGYLSVRSGTEMVIDRFVYDEKNAANSNFLVSLVRGGFRSITGLIGKTNPDAYQIRTGTATVGIRGTDHEPMFIPKGMPSIPSQPEPGFYDKVNEGETFIRNGNGLLTLKRGQVGFAPVVPDKAPLVLQKIPDFYKIEVKTDARDPKESVGDANRKAVNPDGMLRPSLAARREAIKTDATLDISSPVLTSPVLRAGAISTLDTSALVIPGDKTLATSSATIASPAATTLTPLSATVLSPAATLTSPSTTLVAPIATTTLIAPAASTLVAPTTMLIAPTTTLVAPIAATTISPVTTMVAPTTTLIAPATTLIAPTTILSPTTTIKSTTLLK